MCIVDKIKNFINFYSKFLKDGSCISHCNSNWNLAHEPEFVKEDAVYMGMIWTQAGISGI